MPYETQREAAGFAGVCWSKLRKLLLGTVGRKQGYERGHVAKGNKCEEK